MTIAIVRDLNKKGPGDGGRKFHRWFALTCQITKRLDLYLILLLLQDYVVAFFVYTHMHHVFMATAGKRVPWCVCGSQDSRGCLPIHTLFDMESLSLAAAYARLAGSWVSKGRSVSPFHVAVGWWGYRCTQLQPAF